jgi:uncharacterized repeat protein (TIGR04138 family)
MQPINFEELLEVIVARDTRYHRDAYHFVRSALDHAQKPLSKAKSTAVSHVTGQELLKGIRDYALEQFGPMSKTVFEEWGVHRCEDFGELVFNMVDQGLLSKTETDSREDFKGGFDFHEAFCKPFIPAGKPSLPLPSASTEPEQTKPAGG